MENIILISEITHFALSLKRVVSCLSMRMYIVNDEKLFKETLKSKNKGESIVCLDSDKQEDVDNWLLEILRGKLNSLLPVVVFGYALSRQFESGHPVFKVKPKTYIYLKKPLSLFRLIRCINTALPLNDSSECEKDLEKEKFPEKSILKKLELYLHKEFNPIFRLNTQLTDYYDNEKQSKNVLLEALSGLKKCMYLVESMPNKLSEFKNKLKKYNLQSVRISEIESQIDKILEVFKEDSEIKEILNNLGWIKCKLIAATSLSSISTEVECCYQKQCLWIEEFITKKNNLEILIEEEIRNAR